jgi:predicted transposase YbfD/YdcC
MEGISDKPRLARLLDHFSALADARERWRVAYPLPEVLLLVVCGTIAACDDYDDIRDWGAAHLGFLRRFLPYHHGLPCADWLRTLMNRLDPALFSACFMAWAREVRPDAPDLIAIDGKTSRRSHDRGAGRQALHLVSAFATNERLVLGQEAVEDTSCEQAAIPALLRRLADAGALKGAVVTIDAIACNPTIAAAIVENEADYLLSVKQNQPNLLAEIASAFAHARAGSLDVDEEVDKGHGRIETRRVSVSHEVGWMASNRRFPGEYRFPQLAALIRVEAIRESKGHISTEQRYYIASAPLTAAQATHAIRAHWRIENALHWVLDVTFREDLSRLRIGYGAENMALVRHFALNLLRTAIDKRSLKTRRKRASFDPNYLQAILGASAR